MTGAFLNVLNMSLTASYAVIAVITVRLFLKKAPKIFSYSLWAVVLFRLLFTVSFESSISLIPKSNPISDSIIYDVSPAIHTGISAVDNTVNNSMGLWLQPVDPYASVNPMGIIIETASAVWIAGAVILLTYAIFSYFKLKRRLTEATVVTDNIFETDFINIPFVLGIIKPKIFIPVNIPAHELSYIIKHEQTHIKRYDHLVKYISFLVLSIHWFNPLIWFSYFLMSKDMEMSCDESVMKDMGEDIRSSYSNSLLSMSLRRSGLSVPLAFGERNVKSRIKNILNYKKRPFWFLAAAIVAVTVTAAALGTNPIFAGQYDFPVNADEMEKILTEQKMDFTIIDENAYDPGIILSLKNESNITFGVNTQLRDGCKVLNLTWALPGSITPNDDKDFYRNILPGNFKLAGILYGNKGRVDRSLNELSDYYLREENYNKALKWDKRAGNDHLVVNIRPKDGTGGFSTVTLLLMPHEAYENYLRLRVEFGKLTAEAENTELLEGTVADLKEIAPPDSGTDFFYRRFLVKGNLTNIRGDKVVSEAVKNINSPFLKLNSGNYQSAELTDHTGSVKVFLETSSLNKNELEMERNYYGIMFYNGSEPVYVLSLGALE